MNLPAGVPSFGSLGDVARHLRTLASSIAVGWNKEHLASGAHSDVTVTGLTWNGDTQTTVGAAGGASALPATPTGYVVFTISGTEYVIPYYAKS
jgi:hypothetical protein